MGSPGTVDDLFIACGGTNTSELARFYGDRWHSSANGNSTFFAASDLGKIDTPLIAVQDLRAETLAYVHFLKRHRKDIIARGTTAQHSKLELWFDYQLKNLYPSTPAKELRLDQKEAFDHASSCGEVSAGDFAAIAHNRHRLFDAKVEIMEQLARHGKPADDPTALFTTAMDILNDALRGSGLDSNVLLNVDRIFHLYDCETLRFSQRTAVCSGGIINIVYFAAHVIQELTWGINDRLSKKLLDLRRIKKIAARTPSHIRQALLHEEQTRFLAKLAAEFEQDQRISDRHWYHIKDTIFQTWQLSEVNESFARCWLAPIHRYRTDANASTTYILTDHATDFSWIVVNDRHTQSFTPNQRMGFACMYDALKADTKWLRQEVILDAISLKRNANDRLQCYFRNHPAWGTLIVHDGKGNYRLNMVLVE